MSRTNTNGDTARTVRMRGGYDTYFTQNAVAIDGTEARGAYPAVPLGEHGTGAVEPPSEPVAERPDDQAQQMVSDSGRTRKIDRPWPTQAPVAPGPEDGGAAEPGSIPAQPVPPFPPPAMSEPLGPPAAPLGEAPTPPPDVSARHNIVPGRNQAFARPDEATARPGEGTARPPEAAVQPPETSAQPPEATVLQPEVEIPYSPAAALARRDVTTAGPHATQMPGTQWAATPAAPPWAQGPTAYTTAHPEVHRPEARPATLSSQDLLSQIAAMKQAKLRSNAGMRGALNKVGFNLGLSPGERRFEDRRSRIRRPLNRTYQIAVLSVKGGVGRTTITATLGSTFSHLRPDRVVAVDANPDFGDLATRTSRHPYGLTLRDLAYAQNLDAFSAVHSYTAINSADLAVVASPWTTESVEALSGPEFAAATDTLRRHYNLMLVDCGTGVLTSATSTVMRSSDSVVVVTPATVGGVKGAVATLNWLNMHGFPHLVENSIVAIVHQRPDKPIVEVAEIEKLFATVSRPTCVVPYDQHLAEGGEIDLRLVDKETEVVFEELAAALADNFSGFTDGRHAESGGYR